MTAVFVAIVFDTLGDCEALRLVCGDRDDETDTEIDFVDSLDNDAPPDFVALLLELGDTVTVVDSDSVPVDLGLRVISKDTRGELDLRGDTEVVVDDVELRDDFVDIVGDGDVRRDALDFAVFERVLVAVAVAELVGEDVADLVELLDFVDVDVAVIDLVSKIPILASLRGSAVSSSWARREPLRPAIVVKIINKSSKE